MLLVQPTDSKIYVRLSADRRDVLRRPATVSCNRTVAPRPRKKIGNIASPWRYEAVIESTLFDPLA
jgi:hypothetical protein